MGMFDEVVVKCPDCGGEIVFQSKSGASQMRTFSIDNVPSDVLPGIMEDIKKCDNCGKEVQITNQEVEQVGIDARHLVK